MAYLTLEVDALDTNCIFLNNPTLNTVIPYSQFYKVSYSNEDLTLSGLYLTMECTLKAHDRYNHKYVLTLSNQKDYLELLRTLEIKLLSGINAKMRPKLYDSIKSGTIRFTERVPRRIIRRLIIKISGVWQSKTECGLTYKFIPAS
tara:strand:- start:972 stop:1409 length:438 start_codon:yes stop_codon:yes gene_type:complete